MGQASGQDFPHEPSKDPSKDWSKDPSSKPSSDSSGDPSQEPSLEFLRDMYGHLPLLIVRLTADGIVLGCNREVTKVTGFTQEELFGKNWWGILFPGKLFRQVPGFISAVEPHGVLRDVPMTLQTKEGKHRTIAWTRFARELKQGAVRETVLIGMDLTDRLTDADRAETLGETSGDEEFVTPLAISPPALSGEGCGRAIQEVHEFLTQVDRHVQALETALGQGELSHVASLADHLRNGAHACGLLHVSSAADGIYHAAIKGSIEAAGQQITELVTLCRGRK